MDGMQFAELTIYIIIIKSYTKVGSKARKQ